MREEDEEAVRSLKAGKSPVGGVSSLCVSELRRRNNRSPDSDMQEDLEDEGMAKGVVIPLTKMGNFNQCQNNRTISLIFHLS